MTPCMYLPYLIQIKNYYYYNLRGSFTLSLMLVNVNLSRAYAKWVGSLCNVVGVCVVDVRNRRTMEHVSMITDFCSDIYVFLCRSNSFNDVCNDFGMSPVDEIMIGMILTVC